MLTFQVGQWLTCSDVRPARSRFLIFQPGRWPPGLSNHHGERPSGTGWVGREVNDSFITPEEALMEEPADPGEVAERIARHAERPGFRISELRMSPTQRFPATTTPALRTPSTSWTAAYGSPCAIPMSRSISSRARAGVRSAPGARIW